MKLPGVEVSSGSLGQGLSIAVGMALAGKLDGGKHSVFCIMGDGEQQEGNIWEAAMEASHFKLDNLVAIIDRNRLQIDGWVKDVMNVEPLDERYRSFGWEVIEIDGHDVTQVVDGLQKAKNIPVSGKPTVIIANTVKGKGVSFMENIAGWHGKAPSYDEMVKALEELGLKQTIAYDALLKKANEYQKEVEVNAGRQDAELLARLLVEQAQPDESEDGTHTQRLWAIAAEQWRRRASGVPRPRHLRLHHHQRLLFRQTGAQESLDQHGHRGTVGDRCRRRTGAGREVAGLRDLRNLCRGPQSGPDPGFHLLRKFQCIDRRRSRRSFGWT